jgi:hypothetical protein
MMYALLSSGKGEMPLKGLMIFSRDCRKTEGVEEGAVDFLPLFLFPLLSLFTSGAATSAAG